MKKHMKEILNFSKTLKVLYVEDNFEVREQTLKLFKNFFNDIVIATNGQEGLEEFKKERVDIVFADISMPFMNGIEMLNHIRKLDENLPCVLISAHNEIGYFTEAIKLGVDGFVIKPIDIKQFSMLLYKILEKLKLKRENINYTDKLEKEVEKKTKELSKRLYTDELTLLPNRAAIIEEFSKYDKNYIPIIFMIDIDSFRTYNELYGIDIANEILVQFSKLLSQFAKDKGYKVFRIFGDEFVLFDMVEYIDMQRYEETTYELLEYFAKNRLHIKSLNEDIELDIAIGMSFGNSNSLAKASIALYNAKSNGKKYSAYSSQIDRTKQLQNNLYWRKEIKKSIEEDRVTPYFQPIVNRKQQIIKYESLIRILQKNKDNNTIAVTPNNFLDISRQTKKYEILSYKMIEKTFKLTRNKPISFSINLDYQDLYDRKLISLIKNELQERDDKQHKIILEILEDQQIKDYHSFASKLQELKKLGALVAIDDFGSGYSNLSHVIGLSPDYLKIDSTLVKNVVKDLRSRRVIKAVVNLSKSLGMKTIAEFVSDKEVFDIVYELGVDEFQGYYFGKPMSIDDIKDETL